MSKRKYEPSYRNQRKKDENLFQFQCGSLDKFATIHKNY